MYEIRHVPHMVAINVTLISEMTKRKKEKKTGRKEERKERERKKKEQARPANLSITCHPRGGGDPVNDVYSFVDPPVKPEEN